MSRPNAVVTLGLLTVTLIGLGSCQTQSGSTGENPALAATARIEANKATYRRFNDAAFGRGDTTIVDSLVAENFVEHEVFPGLTRSRAGLKHLVAEFRQGFPDGRFSIQHLSGDGDLVWAHSTIVGTNTGSFMGGKATGKAIEVEDFDLVRFENGRIVEHWGQSDNAAMLAQMGLSSGPPSDASPSRKK